MKIGPEALTDTQRVVLAAGKALAEELGLTPFSRSTQEITISDSDKEMAVQLGLTESSYTVPTNEIAFIEGQTALIATPNGINVGIIEVEVLDYEDIRNTTYLVNGELLFKMTQRFRNGKWRNLFTPIFNLPANSVLYVS